ncbi:MAG: arginine--tRNA ligase [Archaeoglobaceae archaeon]|nr:arginine--tRNA ligase [Archaeoglobaceae archaeon]
MFLKLIEDAVKSLGKFGDEKYIRESDYADLTSTIAFKIAKDENSDPQEVANNIVAKITPKGYIGSVESVNGYLNLFANYEFLEDTIEVILTDENYGSIGASGDVLIEHTSANPDGPLHIGHIRNSIIGDTLARIFRRAGFNVRTHYYINDMGRQMALTVLGVEKFGLSNKKPDHAIADAYISANKLLEKNPELEERVEELMLKYEAMEEESVKKFRDVIEKAMSGIKETLKRLNIEHDEFIWESEFIRKGYVERVLNALDLKNLIKKDKAWIVELEGFEKEVVLKRENGTTLYITRDLAYHLWKNENFKRIINVWGADHKLYGAQLLKLLEILGIKTPEIVFFEFVSLPEGRMSTRKGKFISADELIEKVKEEAKKIISTRDFSPEEVEKVSEAIAIGAIRFDFLKVAPEKPMVFDMRKALDFERQTGSYIQYTFSRACSILKKCRDEPEFSPELCGKDERALIIMLSKLPFYVYRVVNEVKPNLFAEYMVSLASKFNEFYRDYPVLKAKEEVRRNRIAIVLAVSKVLKNGLELMGIEAIERM